jgi:O-acetylhomoserine/O-acetylserine sulfhydrylase-like pyridoxal-dependent enzyme
MNQKSIDTPLYMTTAYDFGKTKAIEDKND